MPVEPPKDLSDKSLELYFDKILEIMFEFIQQWDEEIKSYYKETER